MRAQFKQVFFIPGLPEASEVEGRGEIEQKGKEEGVHGGGPHNVRGSEGRVLRFARGERRRQDHHLQNAHRRLQGDGRQRVSHLPPARLQHQTQPEQSGKIFYF